MPGASTPERATVAASVIGPEVMLAPAGSALNQLSVELYTSTSPLVGSEVEPQPMDDTLDTRKHIDIRSLHSDAVSTQDYEEDGFGLACPHMRKLLYKDLAKTDEKQQQRAHARSLGAVTVETKTLNLAILNRTVFVRSY